MDFPLIQSNLHEGNLVYIICGSTASGKSALAQKVALQHNGVIINADSLQIVNVLPILTAQPLIQDMQKVPHELYGIFDPSVHITAQMWRLQALEKINNCFREKKLPVVVGGTGLYLRSLIQGLSPIPEIPDYIKQDIDFLFETSGKQVLILELEKKDPEFLKKHDDPQRLKRALAVVRATGKSILFYQSIPPKGPEFKFHTIMMDIDRQLLRKRIHARIMEMINLGVIDEVREYIKNYDFETFAIGFSQIKSYLLGSLSLIEMIDLMSIKTSQYAKRQSTWFRNQMKYDFIYQVNQDE